MAPIRLLLICNLEQSFVLVIAWKAQNLSKYNQLSQRFFICNARLVKTYQDVHHINANNTLWSNTHEIQKTKILKSLTRDDDSYHTRTQCSSLQTSRCTDLVECVSWSWLKQCRPSDAQWIYVNDYVND